MEKQTKKKKMSDISRPARTPKALKTVFSKSSSRKAEKEMEKKLEEIEHQVEKFEDEEKKRFKAEEAKKTKSKGGRFNKAGILAGAILIVAFLAYLAIMVLPRAEIKITTKKSEWNYIDSVSASKGISQVSLESNEIPAEVFSLTKNFSFSFPATGNGKVETKATGKITIYNNYSSSPQILIATTRFETPDGKIYRLDNKVTVPGKINNVPGKVEASVTADKAGEDYNIGLVDRFFIPGFKGSPRYQGFYGESLELMAGGFIGVRAYPTDADIKQAKEKSYADLKDYVDSLIISQMPEGFKIIDGARQFLIIKEEAGREVDEKGNFTFFSEGKSSIIAFKEENAMMLMELLARKELGGDFRISSSQLEYGAARADFAKGTVSFAVDFKGIFEKPVGAEEFKGGTLSLSEEEIKGLISSYDSIEKATVSFWPFWVNSVPSDPDKVNITMQ